jgi:hypothetical protein
LKRQERLRHKESRIHRLETERELRPTETELTKQQLATDTLERTERKGKGINPWLATQNFSGGNGKCSMGISP